MVTAGEAGAVPLLQSADNWAHFLDAEEIVISNARLGFQILESGHSVLDEEIVAPIVKVAESAARCISAAVSVLDGALVHVQTFAADSAHYLHANGGKEARILCLLDKSV